MKKYEKKHGVSMVLSASDKEHLDWLQFQLNTAYSLLISSLKEEQIKDIFARRNIRFAISDLEYMVSPETIARNGRVTDLYS